MNKFIGLALGFFIISHASSLAVDRSQLGSDIDGEFASNFHDIGWSVSLTSAGDRVAIGTPWGGSTSTEGMVRIYEYSPAVTNWVQLGTNINGEG